MLIIKPWRSGPSNNVVSQGAWVCCVPMLTAAPPERSDPVLLHAPLSVQLTQKVWGSVENASTHSPPLPRAPWQGHPPGVQHPRNSSAPTPHPQRLILLQMIPWLPGAAAVPHPASALVPLAEHELPIVSETPLASLSLAPYSALTWKRRQQILYYFGINKPQYLSGW